MRAVCSALFANVTFADMTFAAVLIAAILFAPACVRGQASAADAKPPKRRTVYVKIKGPEEAAAELRAFFADVASENGLFMAEDPHQAGSRVSITVEERKVEKPLYAEVVAATLVSRAGKPSPVYSCKKITDGAGYSTITKKSGKVGLAQDAALKHTVWVERKTAPADLVEAVTKEIANADFQVITAADDAEFTLKDIRLVREPLRVTAMEAKVESVVSPANGAIITLHSNVTAYLSVLEPISAEAEGCRDSIRHVTDGAPASYQQVATTDIAFILRNVK